MRSPPNRALRLLVVPIMLLVGVGILFAVMKSTNRPPSSSAASAPTTATESPQTPPPPPASEPAPAPAEPTTTAAERTEESTPAPQPEAETPTATAPPATAGTPAFTVRRYPVQTYAPIGGDTPAKEGGQYEMELRFSPFGSGLERLTLANHRKKVTQPERQVLQEFMPVAGQTDPRVGLAAYSVWRITIDGIEVFLDVPRGDEGSTFWREVAPGTFEAVIADQNDRDVMRITRRFILEPGSYEFRIDQRLTNLTDRPLSVIWREMGPIDQPPEVIRYGGDPRHVRFGYMAPPSADPSRLTLAGDGPASLITRADALGSPGDNGLYPQRTLWPGRVAERDQLTLVWTATTSRYFTVAAMPPLAGPTAEPSADLAPPDQRQLAVATVERVAVPTVRPLSAAAGVRGPFVGLGLELVAPARTVAPGATTDYSLTAYAGPTSSKFMAAEPAASRTGLASVIVYTFGGPCAFCTFQTITHLLRGFLGILHDFVLFDWALAIMVLVVCVRTLLHPVTRWSQINMLRFSKSLQALAPKQKAIQEKYKDDPIRMRQEVAKLMQEEGVSFGAGAMGCLPAFLQMPVWLALAPMLYFTFELRHQGAFFGVFQQLSGGRWGFFGDLAEPDTFIPFGRSFHVPLLSGFMGPIDGLNIMPLMMGVVFYIQQKYLTPPTSAQMTPEQEQQMKMMRVMTVVLFPLMMYNAPAGLALYFFTNSSLAILESRHIRKRAERLGLDKPPPKKARGVAGGKPGLLERLTTLAEERQKMMEEARRLQAKKAKGKGKDRR